MLSHGLTDLASTELTIALPLHADAVLPTIALDRRSLGRIEDLLPRQIEPVAVVAHVHQSPVAEPFANGRVDAAIHLTAIGNGRFAALGRGKRAIKPDLHRPIAAVR